jgi:hypothetical protein
MMALSSTAHSNNALMYCGTANGVAGAESCCGGLGSAREMTRFHEDHPMALLFVPQLNAYIHDSYRFSNL